MDKKEKAKLNNKIIRAIKTVYDPEIPVDVYELGLIYEINIKDKSDIYWVEDGPSYECPVWASNLDSLLDTSKLTNLSIKHIVKGVNLST